MTLAGATKILWSQMVTHLRSVKSDTSFVGEFASIDEALSKTGVNNGFVVDIAASDGVRQSSTRPLFQRGWRGLAVEMDPTKFACLASVYSEFEGARLARTRVTPHNVAALLRANEVPQHFELLNLDIDSYDLFVLQAILDNGFRPRLISMEINEKVPPPLYFAVTYDEGHYWQGDHFYGCSLSAASALTRPLGYILAGVEFNNALYIDSTHAQGIPDLDDMTAYVEGYRDRPKRRQLFHWNADMEVLHSLSVDEAVQFLSEKFSAYRGKFEARTA
jgi:hypothetical protein